MKTNIFSSENLLMSIAGHLAIFAVLITSFVLIGGTAEQIITQNRVQITEIDLSQVKITRDETSLYNTQAPEPAPLKPADFPQPKPDDKPEPTIGDEPTDNPAVIDPTQKTPDVEPNPNAPKSRNVVRVNRETMSLNRTMTISVVDALRVALTRCWTIDTNRTDITDIRAVAHLTMSKNGMVRDVWFESESRAANDPGFAYVLDTIRGALNACQPFKMLPVSEFDAWEKIQLTFYPTSGKIM